jgi:nucleoid-associated protein YgaU
MKNNFKNPKLIGAIIVIVIAILGTVAFSPNKDDNKAASDNKPAQTAQTKKDDSKVEAASTTTANEAPAATEPETTPATTAASSAKTVAKTAVATTPAAAAVAVPAQPATAPEAPVTTPEVPVEEEPVDLCEAEGRIIVPVGGDSCTYTIGTEDGQSIVWLAASIDKPNAPVHVVIESQIASTAFPGAVSYAVFHFSATADAPLGDFADPAETLTFGLGLNFEPVRPEVTVVAQ